jgi:hypothetical protein
MNTKLTFIAGVPSAREGKKEIRKGILEDFQ